MKKFILIASFFLFGFAALSQSKPAPVSTSSFTVKGHVKEQVTFSEADILKAERHAINNVIITNHKGETKGDTKEMTGVLLKDLLEKISLDADNPKVYSEYYFVLAATDGYKVVYSWNELFNTSTGNTVYIVTEKDHKAVKDLPENILLVSTQDFKTGRRYLKNLESIYVGRAE